ncbi:MAG: hypothetical protein J0I84_08470 [Terrimonas sp.]|nr:hypothetical protein [Terrimonas sp.]
MNKMPASTGRKSLGMKITKERIDILNKTRNTSASVHIRDLAQGTLVEVQLPLQEQF